MSRFLQKHGCEFTELDQEWLILNTDDFTVTKLNAVGGLCWQMLEAPQSIDTLVEAVKQAFPQTPDETLLTEELTDFIDHLDACRLIRHVS